MYFIHPIDLTQVSKFIGLIIRRKKADYVILQLEMWSLASMVYTRIERGLILTSLAIRELGNNSTTFLKYVIAVHILFFIKRF